MTKPTQKRIKAWAIIDDYGRSFNSDYGAVVPNAMRLFVTQESARNEARAIYKKFTTEVYVVPVEISYSLNKMKRNE